MSASRWRAEPYFNPLCRPYLGLYLSFPWALSSHDYAETYFSPFFKPLLGLHLRLCFYPILAHSHPLLSLASPSLRWRRQVGDGSGAEAWTALPSQLHLELLQLLQDGGANDGDTDGDNNGGGALATGDGVPVAELYAALAEVTAMQWQDPADGGDGSDGSDGMLRWRDLREVLHWLHAEGLLAFAPPGEEGGEEVRGGHP